MYATIFAVMLMFLPPERVAAMPGYPGWHETAEERQGRYEGIARAVAEAAGDSAEDAALLLATSFHESAWAPDVDAGRCYRGEDGRGPRCDAGRAVTIWQIHPRSPEEREQLTSDRTAAARLALARIKSSARACLPEHGPEGALRAYASGTCLHGATASREMVELTRRFLGAIRRERSTASR